MSACDLSQPGNCSIVAAEILDPNRFLFLARSSSLACIHAAYIPSFLYLTEVSVPRDPLVSPICPTWVLDCSSFLPFFMASAEKEK